MKYLLPAAAAAIVLAGCSVSTAHISSLATYKEKAMTTAASTFAAHDEIYAGAHAANIPNKVTVNWQTIAEDVEGQPKNEPIPALDESYPTASDADLSYRLSPPAAGWPAGKYKIVLTMMDNGTKRDQKTTEFTVSGK